MKLKWDNGTEIRATRQLETYQKSFTDLNKIDLNALNYKFVHFQMYTYMLSTKYPSCFCFSIGLYNCIFWGIAFLGIYTSKFCHYFMLPKLPTTLKTCTFSGFTEYHGAECLIPCSCAKFHTGPHTLSLFLRAPSGATWPDLSFRPDRARKWSYLLHYNLISNGIFAVFPLKTSL